VNNHSENPFEIFRIECENILKEAWYNSQKERFSNKKKSKTKKIMFSLEVPPTLELGDLSSSLCFKLSKQLKIASNALAQKIVNNSDLSKTSMISNVKVAGGGYINFYVNYEKLSKLAIESAHILNTSYGYVKTDRPKKIIVEHTSVNPAGQIHVGTARNSILGDSLSRLLRARGHKVKTHFYIDDVGKQIAVLVYGYKMIDQTHPKGKTDYWIGLIYAITNCVLEIQKLKKQLKEFRGKEVPIEEANRVQTKLDDWVAAAADLYEKDKTLFNTILDGINKDLAPQNSIAEIMRLYEKENTEIKSLVRRVVEICLRGYRETYSRVGIHWDSWDWESNLVWNGSVSEIIDKLTTSPYFFSTDETVLLKIDEAAKEMKLKTLFKVSKKHEIPPLVLVRSDGTSLYPTRDIAYSQWKLQQADKVINVIGVEQTLTQLQLRVALSLLISPKRAMDLIHFAYELVKIPDYKMSKRRGRYIAFDDILDEAVRRAQQEVNRRSPHLSIKLKEKIAEAVGIGAVKYALTEVAPKKQVVFTWDRVLNFEMNSAPFIQYAHARACNILKKAEDKPKKPNYALLNEDIEKEIIKIIARFPEIFIDATENLTPYIINEFANDLAAKFNSFYANYPVLKANESGLKDARLAMVNAVKIVLRNSLNLLGIEALERM
jgi:arginyl-tRNA synthetase